MSQTSGAEEYDPATGAFRAIRKRPARGPAAGASRSRAAPPRPDGQSSAPSRSDIFYEISAHALRSPGGTLLYRGSMVVIAVVFVLLVYEAVSYRLALGG